MYSALRKLDIEGNIFFKIKQADAYGDDTLVVRNEYLLKEVYLQFKKET